MTDEQLVQFAKESIQAGKGFAPIQTELLTKHGKSMGDANRLLERAKEELGMSADTTEDDIKQAKYEALGHQINLVSWLVFFASLLSFWLFSEELGGSLFYLALVLSGVAIYLRERVRLSFFHISGVGAKAFGALLTLCAISGLFNSCS